MKLTILKRILIGLSILSYTFSYGQKQSNIWYFGNGAGIDFNHTPVSALSNSGMFAFEGCSSIADSSGNLVFYTDGIKSWNRIHKVMSNGIGLMGNNDVTQSALIVPFPKDSKKYYLFTVEGSEYSNGLRFSIVNMDLGGGLGDIEPDKKNVLVRTPVSEKITATHHANGRDIWVLVHGQEDASFYAYLITPDGINFTPVVSTIGAKYNKHNRFKGQMKFSPEGKKLACCNSILSGTELFDFDNQTGIISNLVNIPFNISYGCEFSPDETKLYISQANTFNISSYGIYQFDITGHDSSSISDSKVVIEIQSPRGFGSLQLGADKKIYVARHNSKYLGVINAPNLTGSASDYDAFGVNLLSNVSWFGLPNFVTSFLREVFEVTFQSKTLCLADSNLFEFTGTPDYDSLIWDFGDGKPPQTAFYNNVKHHFDSVGNYEITLTRWSGGKKYTAKQSVILNKSNVTINEYEGCEGFSVVAGSHTYNKTGIYKELLNDCDTLITKLTINPLPKFSFSLVHDSCEKNTGNAAIINIIGNKPFSYLWNNGSTDSVISGLRSGQYSVNVKDSKGCETEDTVSINDLRNECNFFLYVPDAFSPNNDGLNDTYGVSASYLESFDMQIFNSWGELVFRTNDYNVRWDGTFENKKCKMGVYIVVIKYGTKALPNQTLQYRTTIQLIQ
ncbi:MAG: gliding motility-associated C-terminal domain-containing protein [Bacteroidetes bacterium]|nr:gliding motility-associated C-terminal domain-containing protein [Bacteroidota bacterium]